MWERLEVVLATYWTRPFLVFFAGMTVIMGLLFLGMIGGNPLFHRDAADARAIGVLLCAVATVVGWSGMAIFGQVILQFQCPFARLLPGYARPHLIVAGALLLAVWCAACALTLSARPPWPLVIAIPSTFLGATFAISTSAFPGNRGGLLRRSLVLLGGLPAVLLIAALLSHQRGMPAGAAAVQPWHAGLSLLQLTVLTFLIVRYLPESSRFFAEGGRHALPMGAAGFDLSPEQVLKENAGQPARGVPLISPLREADLVGYHGQRWLRRLRLWQAGGSSGPIRLFLAGLLIQAASSVIFAGQYDGKTPRLLMVVMQAGIMIPVIALQTLRARQTRFCQEWLRPVSRQTAVDDYLRGIACDLFGFPLFVAWAAVWFTVFQGVVWTTLHWICLGMAVIGAHVCQVGLVSVLTLIRSGLASIPASGLVVIPALPCMFVFATQMPRDISPSGWLLLNGGVGLAMSLPGVVMLLIARRKWLNRELG